MIFRYPIIFRNVLILFAVLAFQMSHHAFAQSGTWSTLAPMPTARGHAAAGTINGLLYVVGGTQSSGGPLRTNEAYNPATNSWTSKAPMPTARTLQGTNGAVLNGLLYVIGGNAGGVCTGANEAYNPSTDSWSTLAPMPTPRCHLAVATVNGLIYAIGGTNTSGSVAYTTVEVYNPATNSWNTAASMPTGRTQAAADVIGNKIYVLGGRAAPSNTYLSTNEALDISTNTWSTQAPMPTARGDLRTAVIGGLLYAFGGSGGAALGANEAYDPATNSWFTKAVLPTARASLSSGVVNGAGYAIGGFNTSGNAVTTNEVFTACTYSLSSTSQIFAGNAQGIGTIQITAPSGCSWTAVSNANWIIINSGASGTANGTVNFSVLVNTDTNSRSGTISVAGQTVTVTQTAGNSANPPAISLSPTALTFNATQNGSTPAGQSIAISNSGGGTLNWTATTTTASGGTWLTVLPVSGTNSGTLAVSVNISGLAPNSYTGTIQVAASGASNTPQTVGVTLVVSASNPPPSQSAWVTKAPMLTARGHVAAGAINGLLYVVGGARSSGPPQATNEAYNPSTNSWTSKAPMPTARALQGSNGVVVSGLLYVIGGNAGGVCTGANEAYNPATDSWSTLAAMPTPRCHLALASLNGLIYAIGGTNTSGSVAYTTVEVYNPATNSWNTAASMPTGRTQAAADVIGNKIYVLGGRAAPNNIELDTNEAYDTSTNMWTTLAPMPTARQDLRASVVGGLLYAIGGGAQGATYFANEAYDAATNSWSSQPLMPTSRVSMGVAALNGIIYAAGGFSVSAIESNINEAFTPGLPGPSALVFTTSSPLPSGIVGVNYVAKIEASGGTPPYSWSIIGGGGVLTGSPLPPGLSASATGNSPGSYQISGTPTAAGSFRFTVQVADTSGLKFIKEFQLSINPAASSLTITTPSELPAATVGVAYQAQIEAVGGTAPYAWTRSQNLACVALVGVTCDLPPGLTVTTSGISISVAGVPVSTASGVYNFAYKVTDSSPTPQSAEKTFSITVKPAVSTLAITTASPLPPATAGTAYTQTLNATGGTPPYRWSIAEGVLPAGLTLSSSGQITGTPAGAATNRFSVRVTDATGNTETQGFSLDVLGDPAPLPNGTVGSDYWLTLTTPFPPPGAHWNIASGALPPGLKLIYPFFSSSSLNYTTAYIAGIPTTPGVFTFTVANTGNGGSRSSVYTITIGSLLLASISPASARAGGTEFTITAIGSGFLLQSVIRWNGNARTTKFVSSTQLTATIPASDLASAGTALVTVVNPGISNTIIAPALLIPDANPQSAVSSSLPFTIRAAGDNAIVLSDAGVVNGASFAGGPLAPGSIISVFGNNLTSETGSADSLPLPTTLRGTQLLINGVATPLFFVSPGQINAQMPWEVRGTANVSVQVLVNGVRSNSVTANVADGAPGIFTLGPSGQGVVVIAGSGEFAAATGSIFGAVPARPVKPGEVVTIYATGLGAVSGSPVTGAGAPADPLSTTSSPTTVTIGGVSAPVSFSGLSPSFVGLYQVNAEVPGNVPAGNGVPLVVRVGNATSNTVTMAVAKPAPGEISVSIDPGTATVQAGGTFQFAATVSGTTNTSVTWSVNEIPGGNSTVGTISASGLYTAPAAVPNPNTVSIKAISAADSTKSAAASVTIRLPLVIISPRTATLETGKTQQFSTNLVGSTGLGLIWSVNGIIGGNSTIGTISPSGNYTAPLAVPIPRTVTVTVSHPLGSDNATVTVVSPQLVIDGSKPVLTAQAAIGIALASLANYRVTENSRWRDYRDIVVIAVLNGIVKASANDGSALTAADLTGIAGQIRSQLDASIPASRTFPDETAVLRYAINSVVPVVNSAVATPRLITAVGNLERLKFRQLGTGVDPNREVPHDWALWTIAGTAFQFINNQIRESSDLARNNPQYALTLNPIIRDLTGFDLTASYQDIQRLSPGVLPALSPPNADGSFTIDLLALKAQYEKLVADGQLTTQADLTNFRVINSRGYLKASALQANLPLCAPSSTSFLSDVLNILSNSCAKPKLAEPEYWSKAAAGVQTIADIVGGFDQVPRRLLPSGFPNDLGQYATQISSVGSAVVQAGRAISQIYNGFDQASSLVGLAASVYPPAKALLGAAQVIFSLFRGKSKSSGPSVEQVILEQIKQLSNQIVLLQQNMNTRFDRVDTQLNTIFNVLIEGFRQIDYRLGIVLGDMDLVLRGLLDAQAQLNRLQLYTLEYVQDLSKQDLLETMNLCLNYASIHNGADIGKTQYDSCENTFYTWSHDTALNSVWAGPRSTPFDDALIPEVLARPMSVNINYLAQFPVHNLHLSRPLSTTRLANMNEWVLGSRAYLQAAHEWPQYAKGINNSRVRDLIQVGTTVQEASHGAAYPLLFNAVLEKYKGALGSLQSAIQQKLTAFLQQPEQINGPLLGFDLWSGPNQNSTYRYRPPAVDARMPSNDNWRVPASESTGRLLTTPTGLVEALPGTIRLAEQLGLSHLEMSYFEGGPDRHPGAPNTSCLGVPETDVVPRFIEVIGLMADPTDPKKKFTVFDRAAAFCTHNDSTFPTDWETDAGGIRSNFIQRSVPLNVTDTAIGTNEWSQRTTAKLQDIQRKFYLAVVSDFSKVGDMQRSGELISGTKSLLQAYVNLGLPNSLSSDDPLASLLYGRNSIMDANAIVRDFGGFSNAPVTENKMSGEAALMNSLAQSLGDALGLTLERNQQSQIVESLPQLDGTLDDLRAFETLNGKNALALCDYQLSQDSIVTDANAQQSSLEVRVVNGCSWKASTTASWLTVPSGQTGTGDGNIIVSIASNTTGSPRDGIVIVGEKIIRILQLPATTP